MSNPGQKNDHNPPEIMLVEFFGLPGTGKTTIAQRFCERLRQEGATVQASHEFMAENLPAIQRNYRRFVLILRETFSDTKGLLPISVALATPQKTFKDRLKAIYNFLTINALLSRAIRHDATLVLDQGPLQALWSLQLRAADNGTAAKYIPDLPMRWSVVVLSASTDVLKKRVMERETKHSRLLAGETDRDRWARGIAIAAQIETKILEMSRDGRIRVNRYITDADESAESLSQKIHTDIKKP